MPTSIDIKEQVKPSLSMIEKYSDQLLQFILDHLPGFILALVVLFLGMWLVNRVARLAEKAMTKRDIDVSLKTFLKSLISICLKVILIITVAGMMGIQTTSFVTILGAAGLAIGLALQGSLSNFAGGVLILVFKPFKVGDNIEVSGQKGEVKEIQIFNTILLTANNKTVILPNGSVSNGQIVNQSREGTLRANFEISIPEEQDVEKVRAVILSVLDQDKRIVSIPAPPSVICVRIENASVTLSVRFFTSEIDNPVVHSDVLEKIITEFKNNKIHTSVGIPISSSRL